MERKFLEDLGLEKEAIDKVLNANSADIGKAKEEVTVLTAERDGLKEQLETAGTTIEEMKSQASEVASVQKAADKYKEEAEKAQAEAEARVKAAEIRTAAVEAASSLSFTSKGARTAYIAALAEKGLPLENGSFTGLSDFTKQYREQDPEAFRDETQGKPPHFTAPVQRGETKNSWQDIINANYQKAKNE